MRNIVLFALMFLAVPLMAQTTTVSSTGVVDTDSITWAGGTYQISFVPANGLSPASYSWNGGTMAGHTQFSGVLDASGAFSVGIPDNSRINPYGSQWDFRICPNASSGCFSYITSVAGTTQNLTTALNALAKGPRFAASPSAYGYTTVEVTPNPLPGSTFLNVTTSSNLTWNGASWVAASGGGLPLSGGTVTGPVAFSGATTATQTLNNLGRGPVLPSAGTINVVCLGDSICGFNGDGGITYTATLETLPSLAGRVGSTTICSYSGQTTIQIAANYTACVHPLAPNATGVPALLLYEGGTNDVAASGTVANLEAGITTALNDAIADGFTIGVSTIMIRSDVLGSYSNPTLDYTHRVPANNWIRGQYFAGNFQYLFDWDSLVQNPYDTQVLVTGIHPTQQTRYLMAQQMDRVLGGFLTPSLAASSPISEAAMVQYALLNGPSWGPDSANTAGVSQISATTQHQVFINGVRRLLLNTTGPYFYGPASFDTSTSVPHYQTSTNCASSASPAACGTATAGAVTVAAGATTIVVDVAGSNVTSNSEIFVQFDSSLSTRLGVTCNTTYTAPSVSARSVGNNFTITVAAAPTTNPACFNYWVVN